MIEIQENYSLRDLNTFGIDARAAHYAQVSQAEDVSAVLEKQLSTNVLVLGGGSNILFRQDFEGLVLDVQIGGLEVVEESDEHVVIAIGAGENWHQTVMHCIANGWGGIENLSLIPGKCGAAPIQNIGAYGVELMDVFEWLEAVSLEDGSVKKFDAGECKFGYRDSAFKNALKGKFLISRIALRLSKQPRLTTHYGAVEEELRATERAAGDWTIKDVSDAVIKIRQSKLPDPAEIGNAGSFFKNCQVSSSNFQTLKSEFPDIAAYPQEDGTVKIASGWLIDQAGWKGHRRGNCGVHERQALVLVNHGGATGEEIYNLSEEIKADVKAKFGLELVREVNVI